MKKIPALLGSLILPLVVPLWAQDQKPFELTEPLIQPQAPAFSAWIANCTYTGAASEAENREAYQASVAQMADSDPVFAKLMSKNPAQLRWAHKAVMKTGNVRREVGLYTNGEHSERWQTGTAAVSRKPFSKKISFEHTAAAKDERDFPEFSWVSRQNFKGLETIQGRKCLAFEDAIEPAQVEDPRGFAKFGAMGMEAADLIKARAFIDLETRLPVALVFGKQTWTYAMQTPPTETMTIPAEFAAVIEQVRQRQEARNAPLSKP